MKRFALLSSLLIVLACGGGGGTALNGGGGGGGITVDVQPGTATLQPLAQQQFTGGASSGATEWSTSSGLVTDAGLYTAPDLLGPQNVTATSVDDPSKSASATVSVENAKQLPVIFVNNSGTTAEFWVEPDAPQAILAHGTGNASADRRWTTEAQNEMFRFHVQVGASPALTVSLTLNGTESRAANFHGFTVTYDATANPPTLNAVTN